MSKEEREGGRKRERGSNKRSSKVSPKEKKSNPVHRNSRFVFFFQALAFRTHRQGFDVFRREEPRAPEERRARRHGDQGLDRIIFRRGSDVGACQGRRLGSRGELDDGARVAVHEAGAGGHRFDEFGGTKTTRSPRKRERERRSELDMLEERELEERELERKKLDRELRRKKKTSEINAQSNDFPGGERAINFGSAQGGDALALSLSLSLLPRPWRYARVSRGEISSLAPRRFVPNGATQKLRKSANRKKKKKRAGSQKSRAPSSLSFLERASAPSSPHMRGIKKEDTVAVPRSERNGVTPAERAQKKRAIAFASSFPSAPRSRPSSLLSSGSRSLSGSPRALHSLFLIFSNFHLLALLFPFPFSPFSRFRHSHT